MENLGLWPDIISVAKAEEQAESLRMWALWTMAAAAHHNPKVQDALLKHGSLDLALGILESQQPFPLRQKSILLVSCTDLCILLCFNAIFSSRQAEYYLLLGICKAQRLCSS